jgi:hypothetical protein
VKTYQIEIIVVGTILSGVVLATHGGILEWLGSLAVLCSFCHGQISDRMAEKESKKETPDVHCWQWSLRYFIAKEALWLIYFLAHRSYAALVGVFIFLLYPLWRKFWRTRYPV